LWKRYHRDIEFGNNHTIIDLHQRITQAHSEFELDDAQFRGDHFVEILNKKVRVLSPEDTLIYLVINGTKDQWNILRMIADLSYLIHSNPEFNWDIVFKKAKGMGVLKMVLTGLNLISEVTKMPLPEPVQQKIRKDKGISQLSETYIDNLLNSGSEDKVLDRAKAISRSLDSPLQKMRFFSYFLFTPTPQDLNWVSLPESLFFLYRVLRPIRLIAMSFGRKSQGKAMKI
jgi:hypothetical protein